MLEAKKDPLQEAEAARELISKRGFGHLSEGDHVVAEMLNSDSLRDLNEEPVSSREVEARLDNFPGKVLRLGILTTSELDMLSMAICYEGSDKGDFLMCFHWNPDGSVCGAFDNGGYNFELDLRKGKDSLWLEYDPNKENYKNLVRFNDERSAIVPDEVRDKFKETQLLAAEFDDDTVTLFLSPDSVDGEEREIVLPKKVYLE